MASTSRQWLGRIAVGLVGLLVALQLVPYGRDHTNPPVTQEPAWPSPQVRELAVRACFDCHSNQTQWPWYSNVAPISWLVQHDTFEGRGSLNFSEWNKPQRKRDDAADEVREREMPMPIYLWMHGSARLTDDERTVLADALAKLAAAP